MRSIEEFRNFYTGKKVLVTGHTGFKGTYLTVLLSLLGAKVYGYALPAPTEPSLFEMIYGKGSSQKSAAGLVSKEAEARNLAVRIEESAIGDIRDFAALKEFYVKVKPDCVIHMAAQPIVRESYRIPRETFEANVMGTVNLLECLRLTGGEKEVSFLNVTTDKVYLNEEDPSYGYKEQDRLCGFDPYSNSKSCSELVTYSYKNSFFGNDETIRISTARAGNVIGGGDFAKDRILPDCTRAYLEGVPAIIRNPGAVRPFQHVLEPLRIYLTIVMEQALDAEKAGNYNVGPDLSDCRAAGELCELFSKALRGFTWENHGDPNAPHEANFLKLDNTKIKETFGWKPVWKIDEAVTATARFAAALSRSEEAAVVEIFNQIEEYEEEMHV